MDVIDNIGLASALSTGITVSLRVAAACRTVRSAAKRSFLQTGRKAVRVPNKREKTTCKPSILYPINKFHGQRNKLVALSRPSYVATDTLRSMRVTTISAWAAHILAWAACIWFVFAPTYQGVTATRPGEPASEPIRHTATMVEMNGLSVVFWLLVPVLLTVIAVLAVPPISHRQAGRKALLWISAVALLGFCGVSILSIGAFYLPAALLVIIAAIADRERRGSQDRIQPPAG